jgi:NADH-quinone oxidoreductase subunit M
MWMGVYPESFMAPMRDDVGRLLTRIERVTPAGDSRPTPGKPVATQPEHAAGEAH